MFDTIPQLLQRSICCLLIACLASFCGAEEALQFKPAWEMSQAAAATESFLIRGTGDRNNPLRRELERPFAGSELFLQFRLRYDAESVDLPQRGDGEFFVLWLDAIDGGDQATHSGHVPNIGVHVSGDENLFMVRFNAGSQRFSKVPLSGDREYVVVARLWKSQPGVEAPLDQLDLWVDPGPGDEFSPDASASDASAIHQIRWLGFSTGRKTEPTDEIQVSDLRLATSWHTLLGLPEPTPKELEQTSEPVVKTIDFDHHVLPMLRQHCFECHAGVEPESGLRLDVLDDVLNQVTPFDAHASHLIGLVRSDDAEKRMPPPGEGHPRLTEKQIATLSDWVDEGLSWNESLLPTPVAETEHWAFQPLVQPALPTLEDDSWVRTAVDAFIASAQAGIGVKPAPPAARRTLMRRLALDLTGLPAIEPAEFEAEIDLDDSADAWIETLLASPAYGERWARHWLDLARWAESNGHQHNRDRTNAWRYRDYVIRCFQNDKPFDDFIREQIAGDELPYSEDHLIATGFLAAARYSGNELDKEIQRNDILVDIVNTTANAVLGITMECAQCHTHKFDPISIRDYYRFQAFFANGQPGNLVLQHEISTARRLIAARWNVFDRAQARLVNVRRKRGFPEPILVIPKAVSQGMTAGERREFSDLENEIAEFPQTWGWNSPSTSTTTLAVGPHEMRWPLPRDPDSLAAVKTYLRIRGEVKSRGPEVEPGWPAVFGATPSDLEKPRLALADWLASRDHPLTARVWVNRIWQWHFGRGLVESSGNFGTQGTPPAHPQLLDWLASEFVDSGWSTKHIHRLILRSRTYRQSSLFSEANDRIDPAGITIWRWHPRRLEAEAIRDNVLAVAGRLDPASGGPSVPAEQASQSGRRSVYLQHKRGNLAEALTIFDTPDSVTSCSRRRVSTVALQPLYLLNSEFMNQSARELGKRVRAAARDESDYVPVAFEIVLGRSPDAAELQRGRTFLQHNSLDSFCLVMMNLNEFLYIN